MLNKRILLMYITAHSGHFCASLAIEKALNMISEDVKILKINAFQYTNPILEKIINTAYMNVIKRSPEVWEYLYDNPKVLRSVQGLREKIHRFNSKKLKRLLEDFRPDAVICTQAFPCGMVADYKRDIGLRLPLFGVLTDHAPHSYWLFDNVDYYIMPSEESKEHFIKNGIAREKIKVFGIPIDPVFAKRLNRQELYKRLEIDASLPSVLIMGGSHGLGPMEKMIGGLENIRQDLQIIVVCGVNKSLLKRLNKRRYRKRVRLFGLVENVDELMEVSDILITKPGGLTTSEALVKELPMIIIHPIPGQEAKNADFLLRHGVAIKAEDSNDVATLVQELFSNKVKLKEMKNCAGKIKKPNAAIDIARFVLESI